jgi:hypothetical protein
VRSSVSCAVTGAGGGGGHTLVKASSLSMGGSSWTRGDSIASTASVGSSDSGAGTGAGAGAAGDAPNRVPFLAPSAGGESSNNRNATFSVASNLSLKVHPGSGGGVVYASTNPAVASFNAKAISGSAAVLAGASTGAGADVEGDSSSTASMATAAGGGGGVASAAAAATATSPGHPVLSRVSSAMHAGSGGGGSGGSGGPKSFASNSVAHSQDSDAMDLGFARKMEVCWKLQVVLFFNSVIILFFPVFCVFSVFVSNSLFLCCVVLCCVVLCYIVIQVYRVVGPDAYFMGIIDFQQKWNISKRVRTCICCFVYVFVLAHLSLYFFTFLHGILGVLFFPCFR